MAAVAVTFAGTCIALLSASPASAAVVPNTWYTIVNANSGKCVDAAAAGTANGTAVQQFTCNGTTAQQWQFQTTSNGNFRVNNFNAVSQVWDVTGVSTADSAKIQLWSYGGGNNQQWAANQQAGGSFTFTSLNSGKCLDVAGASTADGVQLQQFTCNGTAAQSYNLVPVGNGGPTTTTGAPPPPGQPNFGPNVVIFDPSMSSSTIQNQLTSIFNQQASNQFGTNRFAVLFKPGTYNVDVNIGFYEQVLGLGFLPDNVTINGGGTRAGRLERRQRDPELLAWRGEHGGQPARRLRTPGPSRRPTRSAGWTCTATCSWTTTDSPVAATSRTPTSPARSGPARSSSS